MFHLKNLPIAQKLIVMSTSISLTVLVAASTAWVIDSWINNRESLRQEVKTLAQLIADRSNAALAFGDRDLAGQNLNTLSNLPSFLASCIYDRNGKLFASYLKAENTGAVCPVQPEAAGTHVTGRHVELYEPILLDNQTIGMLYMRSDLSRVYNQVRHALVGVLVIFILAGFAAYLLSVKLQKIVSEPVKQLSKIAKGVADHHNYSVRADKISNDEFGALVDTFNEMLDTIETQNRHLLESRDNLEKLVERRTRELKSRNEELEAFCYSVSHDLRAPLRSINGFSQALLDEYRQQIDETGRDYLERVMRSATRMGTLIDDLLSLSRVSRCELIAQEVDLTELAQQSIDEFPGFDGRRVDVRLQQEVIAYGDRALLQLVVSNLIGNAIKYSSKQDHSVIEFGQTSNNGNPVYWVRDNGAGFDMQYADKLFNAFQRLHRSDEFEGTGIGLATVARVVHRHGGEIWAESEPGRGSCFYFTLKAGNGASSPPR